MSGFPFPIPPDQLAFFILITTPTFGLWAIKNFAEGWPWFDALKTYWKSLAVLVILVSLTVVGTLAQAHLLNRPVNDQQLLFQNVLMALIGWLTSDWYKNAKQMVATARAWVYWRFVAKVVPAKQDELRRAMQPRLSADSVFLGGPGAVG